MNSSLTRNEQVLTLAAGAKLPLNVGGDYVYFDTVPDGVLSSINGGNPSSYVEGELHQGRPGEREVETVFFDNRSGGPADVRIVFGMGTMTVAGVATISGAIPLPAGAATAAKQDTLLAAVSTAGRQDTLLAAVSTAAKQDILLAAVATAAKQDAQTALLTALTSATTETPDIVEISGSMAFANCLEISVTNSGATNITVTRAGGSARTLRPNQNVTWRVSDSFNTLATVTVDATGGTAVVSTTV